MVNIKYKCKIEGCGRALQKEGFCYIHYKEKHGTAPYPRKESKKSRVSHARAGANKKADIGTIRGKDAEPEIKPLTSIVRGKNNGKTFYLAQLIYASELLDGQINSALMNGTIDIKVIIDIRFRLGGVLRENAGSDIT